MKALASLLLTFLSRHSLASASDNLPSLLTSQVLQILAAVELPLGSQPVVVSVVFVTLVLFSGL